MQKKLQEYLRNHTVDELIDKLNIGMKKQCLVCSKPETYYLGVYGRGNGNITLYYLCEACSRKLVADKEFIKKVEAKIESHYDIARSYD